MPMDDYVDSDLQRIFGDDLCLLFGGSRIYSLDNTLFVEMITPLWDPQWRKRDGAIRHIPELENVNCMKKMALLRE